MTIYNTVDHTQICTSSYTSNPFTAELHKVESFMNRPIGNLIKFDVPNNADFRRDSSLRAVSPESALFAKTFTCLLHEMVNVYFNIDCITCTLHYKTCIPKDNVIHNTCL